MKRKQTNKTFRKIVAYSRQHTQTGLYHNYSHEKDVYRVARELGRMEGLDPREHYLLGISALTHDLIVEVKRKDNEERTAEQVYDILSCPEYGLSDKDREEIRKTILQTKDPQQPYTLLGKIICDADVFNFSRRDFLAKSELVRQELGIPAGNGWYEGCLKLLQTHNYHTDSARVLGSSWKSKNIALLERIVKKEITFEQAIGLIGKEVEKTAGEKKC